MDEIIEWLRSTVDNETANLYLRAFKLFDDLNVEDYALPFQEFFNLIDDYDSDFIIGQMNLTVETMLESLLNQHGIFVSDDATPAQMVLIIEAIEFLPKFEDANAVLTILDSDIDNEEKLNSILELVTIESVETFLTIVERINPGLIRKIRQLFETKAQQQANAVVVNQEELMKKVELIKKLYKGIETSPVYKRIQEGLHFNLKFDFYFGLVWEEISVNQPNDIARDMLAIIVMSIDKSEKVLEVLKEVIGTNVGDLELLGKILDNGTKQFLLLQQDNGVKLNVA